MMDFNTVYYPGGDTETPITVEIIDCGMDSGDAPTFVDDGEPQPWVEFRVFSEAGEDITDDLTGDELESIENECFEALDREYREGQQEAAEYRMEARYGY